MAQDQPQKKLRLVKNSFFYPNQIKDYSLYLWTSNYPISKINRSLLNINYTKLGKSHVSVESKRIFILVI